MKKNMFRCRFNSVCLAVRFVSFSASIIFSPLINAQVLPSTAFQLPAQEIIPQQERDRVLREQQEQTPDVRLGTAVPETAERLPESESPCFFIREFALNTAEARFGWALQALDGDDDPAIGRCLGSKGINLLMSRVQNAIVQRGYVTTRVLAEAQDLQGGRLVLTIIPGRVRQIRSIVHLHTNSGAKTQQISVPSLAVLHSRKALPFQAGGLRQFLFN